MSKSKLAKILLALGIGVATAATGLAVGCTNDDAEHTHDYEYVQDGENGHHKECKDCDDVTATEAHNYGGDNVCDDCGYVKEDDGHEHDYGEYVSDGESGHHRDCVDGDHTETEAHTYGEDGVCTKCGYVKEDDGHEHDYGEYVSDGESGHHRDCVDGDHTETEAHAYGDDGVCTKCGYTKSTTPPTGEVEYEDVTTEVPLTEIWEHFGNSNKLAEDYTVGAVTFEAGVYFDSTGGITGNTVNNQQKKIYFDLQGIVNSIKFDAKGASSGVLTLYKADGTVVKEFGTITDAQLNLTADNLDAGVYYLVSAGSCRLGNISYTQKLEKGTPESISVKSTNVDFLLNRAFNTAGVSATVTYTNGGTRAVSLTVANFDYSAVNMGKVGTYTVNVTYTENDVTVNGSYEVYVYAVESIELGTYTTNGAVQTNFNQVYKVGGTFSTAGLTVVATAKCGTEVKQFVLNADEYTANTPDLTVAGEVNFTVTVADKVVEATDVATATLPITVVAALTVENNAVTISVNKDEAVSATNFHTVTDALTYLGQLGLGADVVKVINIADGVYNEKVFISLPNVQLIGSDTVKLDHEHDNGVVIVYDALAGATDAAGHTYGTNGSATVTVTSAATDFVAKNITFKNYYNTFELYNQSKSVMSDTQAVALYVDSTKASFIGCKLTSYHDTLYSNKGNHYYESCWIEGHTDYIFGQDAIAYFNDCDIFSIGAGVNETNGGYVTALKPSSSAYYFVYNNCRFDADENTKDGSVALGRAWGPEMKMVVMNSTISAKFSTAAHTASTGNGERYCTMSGNEPKPANMLEYNNTGAGALGASLDNTCTVIDAATAAAYDIDNLENIIGWNPAANYYTVTVHYGELTFTFSAKENSVLTADQILAALGGSYAAYKITGVYTDAAMESEYDYEPVNSTVDLYITMEEGDIVYDKTTTIILNDYDGEPIQGGTGKYKGIEIDATASGAKFTLNTSGDWIQFNTNTVLKFYITPNAEVEVTADLYSGGTADIVVNKQEGYVTITATNNTYIRSITVTYGTSGGTTTPGTGESSDAIQAADNFGANGNLPAGTTVVNGDLFSVTVGEATIKAVEAAASSPYAGKTVTAPDGATQLDFSKWMATNSNGAGYGISIKAKENIALTIYYTFADSSMNDSNQGATPSYKENMWSITGDLTQTSEKVKSSGTAAYEVLELSLDAGWTISLDVTENNRWVIFAMFAQLVVTNPGDPVAHNSTYSFDAIAETLEDPSAGTVELTSENFIGVNSWLTVVTSAPAGSPITGAQKLNYRGPNNSVLEIQKVALSFTVQGTATFKIKIGSTSSSNTSSFALMAAGGTLVEATISGGTAITTTTTGVYDVAGTSKNDELTYTLEAGTYYLVGYDATNSRTTRVYAMSLVDLY